MSENKINILQLGRTFNYGGTETVILNLCKELSYEKSIKINLCTSGGELEKELQKYNIKHYKIGDIDNKNIKNIFSIIKNIRRIIKNEKINIIHSHHRTLTMLANLSTCFNKDVKVIHTAHYMLNKNKLGFLLGKNIVAVGNSVKKNLIENVKVKPGYIKVIYNGIQVKNEPHTTLLNNISKKGIKIVTSINRLSKEKGVDVLIKCIPDVISKYKNVMFIIIGDGHEREILEKTVMNLGIDKYVRLEGFKNNVLEYIKASDFIVSTSRTEGFPITPLEVFSQKKTMIATDVGGTSEIIKDRYNGIITKSEDIEDISNAIVYLLNNENKKIEFERNAYKTIIEKFTLKKMINDYIEYYKRVAGDLNE